MQEMILETLRKGGETQVAREFELAIKLYSAVTKLHPTHANDNHNKGLLNVEIWPVLKVLPYVQTALHGDTNLAQS